MTEKRRHPDYYAILDVPRSASHEQIVKARRQWANVYHPDRLSKLDEEGRKRAEKRLAEINNAFDTIGNPEKRRRYDREVDDEEQQEERERVEAEKKSEFQRISELFERGELEAAVSEARSLHARFPNDEDCQNHYAAFLHELATQLASKGNLEDAATQLRLAAEYALDNDLKARIREDLRLLRSKREGAAAAPPPATPPPATATPPPIERTRSEGTTAASAPPPMAHRPAPRRSFRKWAWACFILVPILIWLSDQMWSAYKTWVATEIARRGAIRARQKALATIEAAEAAFRQKDYPKAEELFRQAASMQSIQQEVQERRSKLYTKLVITAPAGRWSEDVPLVEDKYFRAYASRPIRVSSVDTKVDFTFGEEKLVSVEFANHSRFDFGRGKLNPASFKIMALGTRDVQVEIYVTQFSNEKLEIVGGIRNPLSSKFSSGHIVVQAIELARRAVTVETGSLRQAIAPANDVRPTQSGTVRSAKPTQLTEDRRNHLELQTAETTVKTEASANNASRNVEQAELSPRRRIEENTKAAWSAIERGIAAQGGAQHIAKLKRILSKGVGTLFVEGQPIAYESDSLNFFPDRLKITYRMQVNGRRMTFSHVMNGDEVWREDTHRGQDLDDKSVREFKEESYASTLLLRLLQGPNQTISVAFLGKTNINSRASSVVSVTSQGHEEIKLYFDEVSGLLIKRESQVISRSKDRVLQEVFFDDYEEIDGLKYPHRMRALRDGSIYSDTKFIKVDLSPRINGTSFDRVSRR